MGETWMGTLKPLTRADTTDGFLSSDHSVRPSRACDCCVAGGMHVRCRRPEAFRTIISLSTARGAVVALGPRQWFQGVSVVSVSTFTLLPEAVPPYVSVSSLVRRQRGLGCHQAPASGGRDPSSPPEEIC